MATAAVEETRDYLRDMFGRWSHPDAVGRIRAGGISYDPPRRLPGAYLG